MLFFVINLSQTYSQSHNVEQYNKKECRNQYVTAEETKLQFLLEFLGYLKLSESQNIFFYFIFFSQSLIIFKFLQFFSLSKQHQFCEFYVPPVIYNVLVFVANLFVLFCINTQQMDIFIFLDVSTIDILQAMQFTNTNIYKRKITIWKTHINFKICCGL